jgi:hypothetical protein
MGEYLKTIIADVVNTLAWLRLCSPDEPETLQEWALQALTCVLRMIVFVVILAGTVYLLASIVGSV